MFSNSQYSLHFLVGNKHSRKGAEQHEWTFFVEPENSDDVRYFKSVEVDLHPTFNPSHIKLTSPPFEVKRMGWGTFDIKVKIKFHDGTVKELEYELSFDSDRTFKKHLALLTPLPEKEQKAVKKVAKPKACHNVSPMPSGGGPVSKRMTAKKGTYDSDGDDDDNSINESPMPISPMPISPMPVSPMPISPMPVSPMPISPMPISPMPISPMPISPMPVGGGEMIRQPRPRQKISTPAEESEPISPMPISPMPAGGKMIKQKKSTPAEELEAISPMPISPMPAGGKMIRQKKSTPAEEFVPISPMPVSPMPISPQPISPMPISPMPISPMAISPQPMDYEDISPHPIDFDDMSPHPIDYEDISPHPIDHEAMTPQESVSPPHRGGGGISGFFSRLGLGGKKDDDNDEKKKDNRGGNSMSPQHQTPGDYMSPQHNATQHPLSVDTQGTKNEKEREKISHREKDEQFFATLRERTYPLQSEQIESFRANGFIKLSGVTSREEICALEEAVDKVMKDHEPTTKHVGKMNNLWRLTDDVAIQSFVFSQRLAKIAADLLGVSDVRLYHDQLLMKRNVDKTSWHQDASYWPLDDQNKVVTAWIPFHKVTKENGALQFAAGSHEDGYIAERPMDSEDVDSAFFNNYIINKGYKIHSFDMDVGDISFHTGLCVHTGYPNSSAETRKVMSIIYYADGLHLIDSDNKYRDMDMRVFWPDCQPGALAESPMHPIVYSKN